jgi:uncharacterized protein DUF4283
MASFKQVLSILSKDSHSLSNPIDKSFLGKEVIAESIPNMENGDLNPLHPDSEDEEEVVWEDDVGEEEEKRLALGLIGHIWTERTVNSNAFMNTIKSIWALKYGIEISNIGRNKYQFQFHHWKDKRKVLEGQPWHFDHYAFLLGEVG